MKPSQSGSWPRRLDLIGGSGCLAIFCSARCPFGGLPVGQVYANANSALAAGWRFAPEIWRVGRTATMPITGIGPITGMMRGCSWYALS